MTVSFLNWGVHLWRPSHILRPTPTTVEPLRVSPPEAVAYQFELRLKVRHFTTTRDRVSTQMLKGYVARVDDVSRPHTDIGAQLSDAERLDVVDTNTEPELGLT